MPYMRGGSLESALAASRSPSSPVALGWAARLAIALDCMAALHVLHEEFDTLHYDMKSANILLDGNHRAVLCDFGFAMVFLFYLFFRKREGSDFFEIS